MKKFTALMLALLMILSVASFGAFAQTNYNYTISTEFYGYDEVGGDWTPITTVAAGDAVKMRASISTNFNSGPATLLLAYDKSVLSPTGLSEGASTQLKLNDAFDFAAENFRMINCADGTNVANKQLGHGNITAEQMAQYGFLAISIQTYSCVMYDGSDWIFEVDMTVLGGSKGKSLECFVIPETVCTIENTEGFVSFPYAEDDATDLSGLLTAYLWYENAPTLESKKAEVTVDNTPPVEYTVTWNVDGAEYWVEKYSAGDAIVVPEAPEKEGHVFAGWKTADGEDAPAAMPECDVELFAQYEAEKYTFVFDATQGGKFESNGQRTVSFVYEYGETPEIFDEVPVYPGMEFIGWDMEIPDIATEDITFTAEYVEVEYIVTFVDHLGNVLDEIFYLYGDEVYESDVPEGYKAENAWYTDYNGNIVTFPYTVTEDVVLHAVSEANVYNATFDAGEGMFADGSSVKVIPTVYGEEIAIPEPPVREGYVFVMWDPEPGIIDMEDVYFEAIYEVNETTITFADTGDTIIDPITGDYGSPVTAEIPTPEKKGYTFAGWNAQIPATMPAEDMTITALWTKNTYSVTFVDYDGSIISSATYLYEEEITAPALPTEDGYTYKWDKEVPAKMTDENITITAVRTANEYDVVFDANTGAWADGSSVKSVPVEFGSAIIAPESPAKENWLFAGWSLDGVNVTESLGMMDSINGKKFVALWIDLSQITYEVETYTMDVSGEYQVSSVNYQGKIGETVTAPYTVPYGFSLNSEKSELSGVVTVDGSLVLKVYIDRNKYAFTTVVDGISTSEYYIFGAEIAEPEVPSKAGYVFAGWDIAFPSAMPAEDITVTAVFKIATTIKIKNNPVSRTINYGETLRLTAEVENLPEGASIKWFVDGSGFSVNTSADGMTCELKSTGKGTVTVSAKVVDANGNVLSDASGNEISDTQTVKSNAGIWQKIVSFFKNLFRMNRTIVQVFKIW